MPTWLQSFSFITSPDFPLHCFLTMFSNSPSLPTRQIRWMTMPPGHLWLDKGGEKKLSWLYPDIRLSTQVSCREWFPSHTWALLHRRWVQLGSPPEHLLCLSSVSCLYHPVGTGQHFCPRALSSFAVLSQLLKCRWDVATVVSLNRMASKTAWVLTLLYIQSWLLHYAKEGTPCNSNRQLACSHQWKINKGN